MISNPAFNIAEINNRAGTGGNTTLYKTATRHAYNLLKDNGLLLNITLKGIIPDLIHGYFADKQLHLINLMDDVDVWDYNTCFFILEKTDKRSLPILKGGMAAKIFTIDDNEKFPFVYYSGSDKSMRGFDDNGKYKVIRKLPGKYNHIPIYDYTDIHTDYGWKFAFNVMESRKSYYVTDEPIRGGTICYIPTQTKIEAEKLKLFVEHNTTYKEYIKRTNTKYHAFGLRNIKQFDLNQIHTGNEIPIEWNITDYDLMNFTILDNDINADKNKIKNQGQVFTPSALVERTLDELEKLRPDAFTNKNYTFCDTMCGNGQFLVAILERKIKNGIDKQYALNTIYGVDLDYAAIEQCKTRLDASDNIVCNNALYYDYSFGPNILEKFFA